MALTTRYDGQIIIAENPTDMVFGTIMLGDLYGQVLSANLLREADVEEVKAAGSLLAAIMQNPRFAFDFESMFSDDVEPPGLAELMEFPLAGISGRVMPPIAVKWTENGHRGLSIKATSWDKFAEVNEGGGNAYTFDGTLYTPLT
jgi:hypothetical protein